MVALSSPLDLALAAMEAKAADAGCISSARGWTHSALIVRLFRSAPRIVRQLRQHADFHQPVNPEKAAAYREALVIVATHTGAPVSGQAGPINPARQPELALA